MSSKRACWYQTRLGTILLLFVPAALGVGWIANRYHRSYAQKPVIAELGKRGVTVGMRTGRFVPDVAHMIVVHSHTSDHRWTDEDMALIAKLTTLEALHIGYTDVSDAGLFHLRSLTRMEELDLCCTKITDSGLRHLRGMRDLGILHLDGTAITDEGLRHLGHLRRLEWLTLSDTQVTQSGIDALKARLDNPELEIAN